LLATRALKLETCVKALRGVEGKHPTFDVTRALEKLSVYDVLVQGVEADKKEGGAGGRGAGGENTALVWVHVPNRECSILSILVRITFSATVPLNADEILVRERARWEKEARRALEFDLRNADEKYEALVRVVEARTAMQSEDVCHALFIQGHKPHGVGLILCDPSHELASPEARGEAAEPNPYRPPGLLVARTLDPSPARSCDRICAGDILVSIDGKPVVGATVLEVEARLRGAHRSRVVLGLLAAVSLLPYQVELVREGGVRLTAIIRLVKQCAQDEVHGVKEKYDRAIALTRERFRLQTQLRGAPDERALRDQCQEDVQAVYNRAEQDIAKLQHIQSEKVQVLRQRQAELLTQAHYNTVHAKEMLNHRFHATIERLRESEARLIGNALREAEALVKVNQDIKTKELQQFQRQQELEEHAFLQQLSAVREACETHVQSLQAAAALDVAALEEEADEREATPPVPQSADDQGTISEGGLWWGMKGLPAEEEKEGKAWEGMGSGRLRREVAGIECALLQASLGGEVAGTMHMITPQARQYQVSLSARPPADITQPVAVEALGALSLAFKGVVREVACGYQHVMAVIVSADAAAAGMLWAWGCNDRGQLGLGHRETTWMPQQVLMSLPPKGRIKASNGVSCGRGYTMVVVEVPCTEDKSQTILLGCGRNERDQLGLNHASEIRSWLCALGSRTGWQGLHVAGASVLQAVCESNCLGSWYHLTALPRRKLERMLEVQGMTDNSETVNGFMAARDALATVYSTNTRRTTNSLHWVYSAHDHLEMVVVPQGLTVGRDGKIFHTNGADEPGQACVCQLHAGFATSALTCTAHGQPVAWTPQLATLATYPPAERWVGTQANASDGEAIRIAKEGDIVRVGVYAQDGGLSAGEDPRVAPGLKNVADGPQHGSNFVQRQVLVLGQTLILRLLLILIYFYHARADTGTNVLMLILVLYTNIQIH
jgi:hypothetical protein